MSAGAISRLFGIVGGFVCLYAISAWSLSQGGTQISDVPGLDPRAPAQSAYFAILVVGMCLFAASALAIEHVRQPTGPTG